MIPAREVALLRVGDLAPQTIIWSVESAATSYDLLRGSLAALPVGPGGGDEVCFNDIGGNTTTDASSPTVGSGFWYLVRGSNACGTGSFGSEGAHGVPAGERTSATCP